MFGLIGKLGIFILGKKSPKTFYVKPVIQSRRLEYRISQLSLANRAALCHQIGLAAYCQVVEIERGLDIGTGKGWLV